MNKIFFTLILLLFTSSIFSQKIEGKWKRTTKQVQNGTIDQDLIGEWKSSINNPLLSFHLNADRTFKWTFMDTVKVDSDSTFWTTPQMYWTVKGLDFYILGPTDEENIWSYTKLGIYYLKKDKLYISNCWSKIERIKDTIKSDLWKKDKNVCVHELLKIK